MKAFELELVQDGSYYAGYDASVDPGTNAYAFEFEENSINPCHLVIIGMN